MKKESTLPTIQVVVKKHQNQLRLCLFFAYNEKLKSIAKNDLHCYWSKRLVCWHLPYNQQNLEQIRTTFSTIANVDFSKVSNSVPLKLQLDEAQKKLLQAFYRYLKAKRFSKSTLTTYSYLVAEFLVYHKKSDIKSVREIEVYMENHFITKRPSISTHRQFISAINHFLKFTNADITLDFKHFAPRKDKKLPNVLSKSEVLRLIQAAKNLKHRVCITLIYSSGLRIGELLRLQLKDLDFDRGMLRIEMSKGRKDRFVPIAVSILPMLNNYLTTYRPKRFLIENDQNGTSYAATSVRSFLQRSVKSAGIKKRVTPHTLRHSYATHLLENGTDIRYIQALLGHSKPETTMIYTHVHSEAISRINNPLDAIVKQFKNTTFKTDKNDPNTLLSGT